MDIEKCKTKTKDTNRKVMVGFKITPELSMWLKEKQLSPTAIFYNAVKELGYNGN